MMDPLRHTGEYAIVDDVGVLLTREQRQKYAQATLDGVVAATISGALIFDDVRVALPRSRTTVVREVALEDEAPYDFDSPLVIHGRVTLGARWVQLPEQEWDY